MASRGEQFNHVREFPAAWPIESIILRFAGVFFLVLVSPSLDVLPKLLSEREVQLLSKQNHVDISCSAELQTGPVHQEVTGRAADYDVLVSIIGKPIPEAF